MIMIFFNNSNVSGLNSGNICDSIKMCIQPLFVFEISAAFDINCNLARIFNLEINFSHRAKFSVGLSTQVFLPFQSLFRVQ